MIEAGSGVRLGGARHRHRALIVATGAVLTCLIGVGLGLVLHSSSPARPSAAGTVVSSRYGLDGQAAWAPAARPAPAINTLPDQTGHRFSLASLRGHTVAIVFFDSHCHQECPLEGRDLASAERVLPRAERPVLVTVSVNPLDTAASARAAVHAWGLAELAPWHWLMGTGKRLSPVWSSYRIFVGKPDHGDIPHTEALYLVDRLGYERSAYIYPFPARFVTHDLRALAPPQARPPPITSATRGTSPGSPPAPATIAHTAVSTRSDMMRGLVSVT